MARRQDVKSQTKLKHGSLILMNKCDEELNHMVQFVIVLESEGPQGIMVTGSNICGGVKLRTTERRCRESFW